MSNKYGLFIVTQRQRKSPYPMITVDEALNIVANHADILGLITVPVNENLIGMVLAEDVYAKEPVPGYRASIVDGYAVVGKLKNINFIFDIRGDLIRVIIMILNSKRWTRNLPSSWCIN